MTEHEYRTSTITTLRADTIEVPTLRVVIAGAPPEYSAVLGLSPVTLGSSEDCTLVVSDHAVSRKHCSLSLSEDGILLRDLGSKNGTMVGRLRIKEVLLTPETVVTIGSTSFTVRVDGDPSVVRIAPTPQFGEALGGCIQMRALFARLSQAAATDATILLRGESGTGKEVLARAVHENSARRNGPFVVFDCSAVTESLFEAELFGHVKGAFTGAEHDRVGALSAAHGGTLFLDEVGEVPLSVQSKLLRAIDSKRFRAVGENDWRAADVRIVAATHRDLLGAARTGAFRSDLYYRLAVLQAEVPPLRERGEDLELLADHILSQQTPARSLHDLPANTLAMLRSHAFPGNVRELRNVLTRLALFPDLGSEVFDQVTADGWASLFSMPLRDAREQVIERFESNYLAAKLRAHAGNVTQTAMAAGMSRQMIYRLMERHGMKPNDG
jgi:DNA-binding NtrC family response regulator